MKKTVLYIVMFMCGILIGTFIYEANANKKTNLELKPHNMLAEGSLFEERPVEYPQSYSGKIGKILVVSGIIKEAYTNKDHEVVLYLKDRNIPIPLNCTLYQSDLQIKRAIRLGETISIRGKFTALDDEMYLKHCKIIYRAAQ